MLSEKESDAGNGREVHHMNDANLIESLVKQAYPYVRDADDPDTTGDCFLGYDDYMRSLRFELDKLRKHGFADPGYMAEKLTSMKRRHERAVELLEAALANL